MRGRSRCRFVIGVAGVDGDLEVGNGGVEGINVDILEDEGWLNEGVCLIILNRFMKWYSVQEKIMKWCCFRIAQIIKTVTSTMKVGFKGFTDVGTIFLFEFLFF